MPALPPRETVAHYSALQLFVERVENAAFDLTLDEETLAVISALCRLVEGTPLAIELAAALLETQRPTQILQAVRANYAALQAKLLDLPSRQRSAAAVCHTSWALLAPAEAQTLARCAVFRGGFTLAAAQTVAAATPTLLEALVHKSLLQPSSAGRYVMHDLLRQFAEEQLAQAGTDYQQSHTAHAAYFTALLATWQPEYAAEQRFCTAVTQEWDNVQTAWAWAVAHDLVALLQPAVVGLAEYYEIRGLYQGLVQTLGAAAAPVRVLLASNQAVTPAAAPGIAHQRLLGYLLWRQLRFLISAFGQLTAAEGLTAEVIALGKQLGDPTLTAWGYYEASMSALYQGKYECQYELLQQALALAQAQGDRYQQAYCLQMIGVSLRARHQYAEAQQAFTAALTLVETVGASRLALQIGNNLAASQWDAGYLLEALTFFQQSLAYAQQMAVPDYAAFATLLLGVVTFTLGDYANARRYLEGSYQAHLELGNDILAAQTLASLIELFLETGEMALATSYCQRALNAPAAQTYDVQQALLPAQGRLHRYTGNWPAARMTYEQAYALSAPHNLPVQLLPIQAYLAAVDLAQGAAAAALVAIEPVLAHFAATPFAPAQRPQELLLIAYEILVTNGDGRAPAVLQQAWAYIQTEAAKIDDPYLHETFLTNVPVNRQLAQLVGACDRP